MLKSFRKYVPQKLRFLIGVISIFQILFFMLLIETLFRFFLSQFDIVKDAYNGKFNEKYTFNYVINRMVE